MLSIGSKRFLFVMGRDGYTPQDKGHEGDFKTPLGTYSVRYGLYRPDRIAPPKTDLVFRAITENDGWCDDPNDIAYNLPVSRPYPASHEVMMRSDCAYDIVIVISHNDAPVKTGLGSAVFLHICRPDHRPTAGCLAVEPEVMVKILPYLKAGLPLTVSAQSL